MSKAGTLYIVSAPSGAGKTTLVGALLKNMPDIKASISHTTRPMRPGEKEGVNYHFVSEEMFLSLINKEAFLEHAQVFNHFYGTSKEWVEKTLSEGIDVILEIDWQGAEQIRDLIPESKSIFILPPSLEALEERLIKRGQDDPTVIKRRLAAAKEEISHYMMADYLLINDGFDETLVEFNSIILHERLKLQSQKQKNLNLLNSLLS
ncbi:guanylate kinase [Porticoccus sp.]|jgi:guanylate kinase|nr:guanylate kinase [Gammaproteobacteria bacterium]MDA7842332.1 guanylate kinase [Porticoccus sp.]MDC1270228.1 guanylate kinase [Porticoccus sp.]